MALLPKFVPMVLSQSILVVPLTCWTLLEGWRDLAPKLLRKY
jgi:hypothetical protein